MPIFFYAMPTTPEYCFKAQELPPNMELNKVVARVEQQGICAVAIEARNLKEARRIGRGLIEDRMREARPQWEK